jgi:hypothetical protein
MVFCFFKIIYLAHAKTGKVDRLEIGKIGEDLLNCSVAQSRIVAQISRSDHSSAILSQGQQLSSKSVSSGEVEVGAAKSLSFLESTCDINWNSGCGWWFSWSLSGSGSGR